MENTLEEFGHVACTALMVPLRCADLVPRWTSTLSLKPEPKPKFKDKSTDLNTNHVA